MTDTRPNDLRASDAEREHHAGLLREHAADGRLTIEELNERLDAVYAARTRGDLEKALADLPELRTEPARPRRRREGFAEHLAIYLAVNALLIAVWALTGAGYFWPIWPLLGWGIGLLSHGSCGSKRHAMHRHRGRKVTTTAI